MKFEGLTPHSSVGVQTKLMTCLIHQNKSVSNHTWKYRNKVWWLQTQNDYVDTLSGMI